MEVAKKRSKIITTLQERQRVEQAILSLAQLSVPAEAEWEAERIAGMGTQVVPALTGLLDTSDPRLLSALGLVAACLEQEGIIQALREAVSRSGSSDRARLAALLILEKYLSQEPDDTLYAGLQSLETAVAQSLVEMVNHAADDRNILLEYILATEQQSDEVVALIFELTLKMGAEHAALPLWALAQSRRQDVADLALQRMGSLRSPESGIMLQALLATLPPKRCVLAERSLRKLRFSGVDVPRLPPPHSAWRSLISPIDGRGSQSVWFLLDPQQNAPVRAFCVLLNDLVGVWDAAYDRNGELVQHLPSECALGTVHQVTFPDAPGTLPLLEATFDTGRRLVWKALTVNHAKDQIPPLGYAALSDTLWRWDSERLDGRPAVELPRKAEVEPLRAHTVDLLGHSAFVTWFVQSETLRNVARHMGWETLAYGYSAQSEILNDLIRLCFGPEEIARYSSRLERMAEWLWLAGERETAQLALVAALTLKESAPQDHPLAQRMVELGLAFAFRNLNFGLD